MNNPTFKQRIENQKLSTKSLNPAMNTYKKYTILSLVAATFLAPAAAHADTLTIEGDLNVTAAGTAEGDLTVEDDATIGDTLTVGEDTAVTSPAVKTDFKVESNGVIWAGEGAGFDGTNLIPTGTGARFMWIPGKSAFRMGFASNNRWDYLQIGDYSSAWGTTNTASGSYSSVWGLNNIATGGNSTAWGSGNFATGTGSTAWGAYSKAESYSSTALGYANLGGFDSTSNGDTQWVESDPLFEIGNGDFFNNKNALTVLKNGRIALGSHSSITALQTNEETVQIQGAVLIGDYADILTATPTAGAIRYDATNNDFEGYDGTNWKSLTSASSGSITLTDATSFSTASELQSAILDPGNGTVVITQNSSDNVDWGNSNNVSGSKTTVWGQNNIVGYGGDYATAWGQNNVVGTSGSYATAWGLNSYATATNSTAWGNSSSATDTNSTAWGIYNKASGFGSTVWGQYNKAEAHLSTAFGLYNLGSYTDNGDSNTGNDGNKNWFELDPLFEIGNGTSDTARANAVTVIKNGQTTLQNKHWFAVVDTDQDGVIDAAADLTTVPADPDGGTPADESSAGEALVVNGHTRLMGNVDMSGSVTIAHIPAQGGLDMGIYDGVP